MIFDRFRKIFRKKPQKEQIVEKKGLTRQISQIFVDNPHNRKPLIAFLEKELGSKVYETTIGIRYELERITTQIAEELLDEDTAEELKQFIKDIPLGGNFYTSSAEYSHTCNGITADIYLAIRLTPGSLSLTFMAASAEIIASFDSVLRKYAPEVDASDRSSIDRYLFHLTGECTSQNDKAGILERKKVDPEWLRSLWEQPDSNQDEIISIIEAWSISGCEDFLIDELLQNQQDLNVPDYENYFWRITLMLALHGRSNKESVKKVLPLFDIINEIGARHFLMKFVGKAKHPELFDFYVRSLKDRTLQEAAIFALGNLGKQAAVPHLKPFLACGKADLSKAALKALSKLLPPEELPPPPVKPVNLEFVDDKLRAKLSKIVRDRGNPVESISKTMKKELEEFSTSMDAENFAPMFTRLEAAGIPGFSHAMGEFLGAEFEKLRTEACAVCTITNGATIFYLVLEREDLETLSFWLCSADIEPMRQINAELDKYFEERNAKEEIEVVRTRKEPDFCLVFLGRSFSFLTEEYGYTPQQYYSFRLERSIFYRNDNLHLGVKIFYNLCDVSGCEIRIGKLLPDGGFDLSKEVYIPNFAEIMMRVAPEKHRERYDGEGSLEAYLQECADNLKNYGAEFLKGDFKSWIEAQNEK